MACWLVLSTDGCVLLGWRISDQTVASGTVTEWLCGCLPLRRTELIKHLSSTDRHRDKRDKRKPGLHPSHYNDALGCVTLDLCVCVHVFHILSLVRWVLRVSLVTHQPPGTTWHRKKQEQWCESMKLWVHSVNTTVLLSCCSDFPISARSLTENYLPSCLLPFCHCFTLFTCI